MRAGKVAGIQLILNNWFLGLLMLFALAGMLGKIIALFACILWHEAAHAVTAIALGYKVREIELLPFGGVARIDRLGEAGVKSDMIIAAAGPLSSLTLAALLQATDPAWLGGRDSIEFLIQVNLMLAFFNLVPALPLDGGRISRAILAQWRDYRWATDAIAKLSKLISLGLCCYAIRDLTVYGTINITFVIAAAFLYASARAEQSAAAFRAMRVLAHKKETLSARGVLPTVHYTALAGMTVKEIVRYFDSEQYNIILVVDDSLVPQGTVTEIELWERLPTRGVYAKIGDFL